MSRTLLSVILIFSAAASSRAQAAGAAQQKPAETQGASEAERLSRQVVDLYKQGKFDEALPPARRAVSLLERESPADDARLAGALNNLAFTLIAAGKQKDAIPHLERSLGLLERRFGREAPQLVNVLTKLAVAHFAGGQKARTGELLARAVEVGEKTNGAAHAGTLEAIHTLADFHIGQRRYEDAEKLLLRAIEATEKAGEQARGGLEQTRGKYIMLLVEAGRAAEAESFVQRLKGAGASGVPVEVETEVLQKRAVFKAAPRYPPQALTNRDQGTVGVQILVDELGRVISAKAVSGPNTLRGPSEAAVRHWRFAPTFVSGVPVKVAGVVKVNYDIH